MKSEEIKNLTNLARIDMDKKEMEEISKDFDSILAYVDQIREVVDLLPKDQNDKKNQYSQLENVMREDEVKDNKESSKKEIMKNMPDKQDGFLKVKKIL